MAAHFGAHPLARSVLGTSASVGALSRAQMLEYFERRYSPGNIVLAAAGNVDFARLIEQTQQLCGAWRPYQTPRDTPRAPARRGLAVYHKPSATQQYVVQITNGPAVEDEDRYAARVLATVLGDETGSRMFWELIDTGLADCAAMSSYEFQGTGIFMTYLSCAPEDAEENLARIDEILAQSQQQGLHDEELAQAKAKILSHVVLQAERPANRLFSVGNNWVQHRCYRTVKETLDNYRAVTLADLAAIQRKYPLARATTVAIGPREELGGVPAEPLDAKP
jgi:predicted Zn-dependent peptidase